MLREIVLSPVHGAMPVGDRKLALPHVLDPTGKGSLRASATTRTNLPSSAAGSGTSPTSTVPRAKAQARRAIIMFPPCVMVSGTEALIP